LLLHSLSPFLFAERLDYIMGFVKKEYEFLVEIGLGLENLGGYVNGAWKATGLVVSSVNPSNN
jgi:hypothetical protein